MLGFLRDQKRRLILTIGIALTFFAAELAVGFYTHSLALIADAFHYLCDLIGFIVALVAIIISERAEPAPQGYTFGWQRAKLLGAFFNGVFLLALGVSILVQAIERFVDISPIQEPKLVLIMGCVGLGLNVIVMSFLHEHSHDHAHAQGHHHSHSHSDTPDDEHAVDGTSRPSHSHSHEEDSRQDSTSVENRIEMQSPPSSPADHTEHNHRDFTGGRAGRDLGMLGVMIHVIGDAINNVGVIIAALIIWKASGPARFYADPAVGVFIAIMILLTAVPLTRSSGSILLQIAPPGVKLEDVKQDIEKIPGIESVHELHIWRLDQRKSVASAHVVVDGRTVETFADKARTIMECLHAYGIHSATLQPEAQGPSRAQTSSVPHPSPQDAEIRRRHSSNRSSCQLVCGPVCGEMRCCPGSVQLS
ncbi:cation efflux family protein [Sarocladium implicatum]|nr:cation efflux family protein [Sarocladium implicatum]